MTLLDVLAALALAGVVPLAMGWISTYRGHLASVCAIGSLLLPTGPIAAIVAVGVLVGWAPWLLEAARRLPTLQPRRDVLQQAAVLAAPAWLAVSGCWFVLARDGRGELGLSVVYSELTALHFAVAGTAATVIGALTLRAVPRWWTLAAMAGLLAGPPLVAAGYLGPPWLQTLGGWLLAGSVLTVQATIALVVVPAAVRGRALLVAGALGAAAPMLLAADWAGARLMGWPTLTLAQMVEIHGALNVACTAGCSLLGWRLLDARPLAGSLREGADDAARRGVGLADLRAGLPAGAAPSTPPGGTPAARGRGRARVARARLGGGGGAGRGGRGDAVRAAGQ